MLRVIALFLAVGSSQVLFADDDRKEDREADNAAHRLLNRVEKLEKRIAELESSLKPRIHLMPQQYPKAPTPPPSLRAPGKPYDYPHALPQPPTPPSAPVSPLPP